MRFAVGRVALFACVALVAASCSGSDDADDDTSPSSDAAETDAETNGESTSSTAATSTTTEPPETSTTVALVTDGATVVVANASIVGGSAGRMTDQLASAGFSTVAPVNATEDLVDSVVHHTDADGALEVAESIAGQLGGVEVSAMPDPVPVEGGELGEATVLVLLGDNQADRTLDELTGGGGGDAEAVSIETTGLTVVVANASGVDGSAGAMTAELNAAGVTMGDPTNAVVQLAESVVHHTDAEGAADDAAAIAEALGGVEVEPLPDEIPTESSDLDGDVLVLLGTSQAGRTLDDLNP